MDKTIDMARESWIDVYGLGHDRAKFIDALKHFEALVRADERNSWPAEMEAMERQVNILTDALAAEREECAKVCEEGIANADDWNSAHWDQACENRAWAIRARGNT